MWSYQELIKKNKGYLAKLFAYWMFVQGKWDASGICNEQKEVFMGFFCLVDVNAAEKDTIRWS